MGGGATEVGVDTMYGGDSPCARKMWRHKAETSKCRRHSSREQVEKCDLDQEQGWVRGLEAGSLSIEARPGQAMELGNKIRPRVNEHQFFHK